jgi:hypothetical protein
MNEGTGFLDGDLSIGRFVQSHPNSTICAYADDTVDVIFISDDKESLV